MSEQNNRFSESEQDVKSKKRKVSATIIFGILGSIVLIAIICLLILGLKERERKNKSSNEQKESEEVIAYDYFPPDNSDIVSSMRIFTESQTPVPAPVIISKENYSEIKTDDIIIFGHYEQDSYADNGPEPIKWRVLSVNNGEALLLSEYVLDCKPFNSEGIDTTWERCSLRNWLNSDFLDAAFSSFEKEAIKEVTVYNNFQIISGLKGGNDTEDKVFLLSPFDMKDSEYGFSDYWGYFDICRRGVPTDYAKKQGVLTDYTEDPVGYGYAIKDGEPTCSWWLRSPSFDHDNAVVHSNGNVICNGRRVYADGVGVRPSVYINLEAAIEP